jgi:hypothetical protein
VQPGLARAGDRQGAQPALHFVQAQVRLEPVVQAPAGAQADLEIARPVGNEHGRVEMAGR